MKTIFKKGEVYKVAHTEYPPHYGALVKILNDIVIDNLTMNDDNAPVLYMELLNDINEGDEIKRLKGDIIGFYAWRLEKVDSAKYKSHFPKWW